MLFAFSWFKGSELLRSRYIVGVMWRAKMFPYPVEWHIDHIRGVKWTKDTKNNSGC